MSVAYRSTFVMLLAALLGRALVAVPSVAAAQEPRGAVAALPANVMPALPAGWSPSYFPDRLILTPPGWHLLHTCALIVMPSEDLPGDFREWFERKSDEGRQGRAVSQGAQTVAERSAGGYEVLHRTAELTDNVGRRSYLYLYAARVGTRAEPVAFFSDHKQHFEKFMPTVRDFVANLRYAAPALAQQSPPQPIAQGDPTAQRPERPAPTPEVTTPAERGVARPAARPSAAAAPSRGELHVESMYWKLLGTRGTVLLLTFYTNGRVSPGESTEGPLAVDLSDAPTYKVVGNRVHITWANGPSVYRREADGLYEGTYRQWRRLPNVDGLRLHGTYTYGGDDGPRITFNPDGAFSESGVVRLVSFHELTNGPTPPPGGSGTYTIRDYTLTLTYTSGPTWRMTFYITPRNNVSRPETFIINNYVFSELRR